MNNKNVHELKLNNDEFKKVKKEKQTIIIRLNDEKNKEIKLKDKILLLNDKKKLKKKVKNLYTYDTIEEAFENISNKKLGYKKKDVIDYKELLKDYKKDDLKKYGILGIEIKKKKHIPKKIFFALLIFILILISSFNIYKYLEKRNIDKFNNNLIQMNNNKLSYIFVDINPSFVIKAKGNKINDIACLNDDCISLYDDINIKGENINKGIDIIYNLSKEKGFDTSKGVNIKSTETINIETKDYITFNYIDPDTENELLNEVKNNKDIKNNDSINNDYYSNLWKELKKDNDYDKIYSCNMNNNKLECYFIIEAITPMADVLDESKPVTNILQKNVLSVLNNVKKTLKKFNIKIVDTGFGTKLYINNIDYTYALDTTCFRENHTNECYEDFGCFDKMSFSRFSIKDLDLLNPNSIQNKIITN